MSSDFNPSNYLLLNPELEINNSITTVEQAQQHYQQYGQQQQLKYDLSIIPCQFNSQIYYNDCIAQQLFSDTNVIRQDVVQYLIDNVQIQRLCFVHFVRKGISINSQDYTSLYIDVDPNFNYDLYTLLYKYSDIYSYIDVFNDYVTRIRNKDPCVQQVNDFLIASGENPIANFQTIEIKGIPINYVSDQGKMFDNNGVPANQTISTQRAIKEYVDFHSRQYTVADVSTNQEYSVQYSNYTTLNFQQQTSNQINNLTLQLDNKVFVQNQKTHPEQNGLYTVTTLESGSQYLVLTRTVDFDTDYSINSGNQFFDSTNNKLYICTNTSSISFSKMDPIVFDDYYYRDFETPQTVYQLYIINGFTTTTGVFSNQVSLLQNQSQPPLIVTSSNLVSNLNVQYLNGQPQSYYTNANNISSGTLDVSYGGTGINLLSQGFIPFGKGNNPFDSSSNLFWDSTNSRLGICNTFPQQALDVNGNIISSNIQFSNQLISTIPTGTSPLIISSTTLIPNLNVQYLNGQPQSFYTNSSNINSGILAISYGGTGLNMVTQGYIPFGQGTNPMGSTSNLFWNSTLNYLGIGTINPTQALDIQSGGLKIQSWNQISQPGTHIHWNRNNVGGCTYIINQKGPSGTGGISFGEGDMSNNFTQTMILTSNGYLGIGTSNPQTQLQVIGNILSSSNIVATNQLISSISGIPPIQVSSTTLVSNLNVQYLNGQSQSFYTNASNICSGILSTSYGGTGLSSLSQGYIPFGQGNNSFGQSSYFFWNQNRNMLGVNNSNPQATLDVITPISNTSNVIIRGGLYRQLQIVPGTTISATNQQSEITFNYQSDYTNLAYSCGIGINTAACGYCNLGISAPGKGLAMTLQSNTGFVGIGTSNPQNGLDIANCGLSIRGSNYNNIQIFSSNNSEICYYLPNSTTNRWGLGQGTWTSTSNFSLGNDKLGNVMTALYSNGFIGIGTSTPASMLDINGGLNVSLSLRGQNTQQFIYPISNGGRSEIGFCVDNNNQSNIWWLGQATGSGISNSFGLCCSSLSSNIITILSNGYVGFGISNPSNYIDAIGNIRAFSNIIANNQLVSTVPTNTPPLLITSSTMVSNLNVQYLNGQPDSYFTNASNLTSGVLAVSQGGTGLSNLVQGYIPFGQDTNPFDYTSNLFWNSTSNYLGIGTNSPQSSLHVVGNILGSYNIIASNQIISGITTGTPPFRVVSTSIVSNLNVQYLNGNPQSYYTNASNINAGILNVAYGGTGITSISDGFINFGSNRVLGQSSNLYYNYTSNQLGIGTSNPVAPISVAATCNFSPDCNGISVFSSNTNYSPILSLRQFINNSSNANLGYISFDWYTIAGFSIGQNSNSSTIGSNVTLDIKNSWNFTGMSMMQFNFGTGFIGLRNPNPASLLDINASSNIGLILRGAATQQYIYPTSNGGKAQIGFCSQSNSTSNIWLLGQATGTTTTSNTFSLYYGTTNNVFTALQNGYLGIGKSNPSNPLDVSGNIYGSYNIIANNQLVSTVSTGTSPIQLASTTLVSNLNAQYLNDQPASYYTNASNLTSGTLSVPQGGTGLSNLSQGYIPFGQNTTPLGYSSNLFWDSTNLRLGIRNSTPQHAIDVVGSIRCVSNIYYSNQLISSINTGTSPFVITSTTMVSNLNVQFLNGQSSVYYTNASNISSGILSASFGGIGLSYVPVGQLVFGSNAQSLNYSSNLYFDSTSNQLQTPQVNLTLDPSSSQAPIIVSNSNMISNLNAQYLGGKPFSYFSSTHFSYIPTGGTGLSNVPVGQLVFGFDSQSLNVSSNLFFDLNSYQLQTPQLNLTLDPSNSQAPIVVSNSNMISNLNAQYLGGQSADHFTSTFVYLPRGGIGISNVPIGQILFGFNSQSLNTSSNLFWDQTNSRLGVNVPSPAYPLDVNGNTNIQGNLIVSGNVIIGNNSNNDGTTQGSLSLQYGGLGLNNIPTGLIPFGFNQAQINYSSNFYWDFTNSRLGICNSNPKQALDIVGNITCSSNIYFFNQLVSTVATGTSPFNITSSTLVSNLNVQYLSGQPRNYYTNASNISSGILSISYGGTGVNTVSQGFIPFGQGSNPLSSTSNLFWNSVSNFLGIGTSNPSSNLDVQGTGIFRNTSKQIQLYNTSNVGGCCEIKFLNQNNSLGWSIGQNTQASGISNFGIYNGYSTSTLLSFNVSNYVGINTSSPSNALHVIGNIFTDSNLIINNQLISTIAIGTPPLNITSTTLVSNLNVQYLNGQPGSYYTNASNISSGILSVIQGGTGISNISQGQILFGQGSNPISFSSNLFWDSTNFRLGIRNPSPQNTIDVVGNISCSSNIQASNQVVVSVLTGTAPLSVTSTSLVPNLNVQFLNGQPSSYFTNASNINFGVLNSIFGGTGLSFLQQGFIPFGQGSNSLGYSSNLFWDSTNFKLGIRNSNPQQAFDVIGNIICSSNIYFSNQLISYVSTGTAPLTVVSTTLVSNLNVQYLNGQIGSYYTNASNISSGILAVSYGGTGITYMNSGFLHFGSNGILGQSSNLFWNNTSNYLGIGTSNPGNALDVVGNIRTSSNIISSNQFVSTIATGTAAFNISSTTLVSNLNVQYLNGQLGSYYTNASNISSGTLAISYGGTGLNTITLGYIPFGQGCNSLGSSSNLFWDSTNLRLGIRNPNPQHAIDVIGSIICSSNIYFSNQLLSSVSTGTPPFSVNSTTLVSNLNVQYLNGQPASYYTNTSFSNISQGLITFGQGNSLGSSSNLFWNNSNYFFGVNNSNPQATLDVITPISNTSNVIIRGGLYHQLQIVPGSNISSNSNYCSEIVFNQTSNWSDLTNSATFGLNTYSCGQSNLGFSVAGKGLGMTLQSSTGFLGVGTSNPSSMVDINADGYYPLTVRGAGLRQVRLIPQSNNQTCEIVYQQNTTPDNLSNAFWTGVYNSGGYYSINSVNYTNVAAFTSNGYVGIGTNSPNCPLHIVNSNSISLNKYGYLNSNVSNNTGYVSTVQSANVSLYTPNGRIVGIEINAISDYRFKTNIQPLQLQEQYDTINKLIPVQYSFKSQSNQINYGFIAQDLLKSNLPNLVSYMPNDDLDEYVDNDKFKSDAKSQLSLNYNNFIAIQTKVIQDLCKRIHQNEQQINNLSQDVLQLEEYIKNKLN